MLKLQSDTKSNTAQRILDLLEGLVAGDSQVERGLALLREWDADVRADSAAAALFEVWAYRHLSRAVMTRWIQDKAILEEVLDENRLYDVFEGSSAEVWLSRLEDPSQPAASTRGALLESLAAAITDTESLLGSDWNRWRWGRLHHAHLLHPASRLFTETELAKTSVGPAPRGGSGTTVNSTSYSLDDFVQRYGASFRMLLDVGRWDDSVVMNTPGQSGDPSSPHYRDLFKAWARDESIPLLYSRERIVAETERRILLRPTANPEPGSP
jgi:penicillin amidase